MHPYAFAEETPDKTAIVIAETDETLTYRELEALSNRVAQLIRARGLRRGDVVAILMENGIEFLPICWGAQRSGIVFTAMSTKLSRDEAQYILRDSGAKMLFAGAGLADVAARLEVPGARIAVGGSIPGFEDFGGAVADMPETRIADESQGRDMLYSSGTTGRPKGVIGPLPDGPLDEPNPFFMLAKMLYRFDADMIYLSPAPLYHAAPLRYSMAVHRAGGTLIVMRKFDPERYLALVEQYRVTHSQLVPTMFVRMLKLPEDARARYDVSSLRVAIHAAAPCPVEVKRRMIEWWGETIYEYYASTEGTGFCAVSAQEWLKKPGTVGRSLVGEVRILDEEDNVLPPGREGRIYFAGGGEFAYHNDPGKTKAAQHPEHGATFGDIGYIDADGYLFLTDRAAYMIITGGVNVYPQETEDVLVMHPKVSDVAVIGVPHEEMGEEVKAVVQPRDWSDAGPALEAELIAFARARLSHVKCPRSIDFEAELPRHDTGKLYKRLLKDRYRQAP